MKVTTHKEHHKSINRVIDYINVHLKEAIDLSSLGQVANISEFHFHRIFKAFIGESVGAYITRIRLEKAAGKLQMTDDTLETIAEECGYNSQHSLSKAFKNHFGISPSAFRNLETYFTNNQKKKKRKPIPLQTKIQEIEKIDLVYIRIIAKYGEQKDYDLAWKKLWLFANENNILNGKNEYIGLSFDDPSITQAGKCRFYACISTEQKTKAQGEFGLQTIDKGKYAIFTLRGAYSGLDNLYNAIYFDWLPNTDFELRNSMPFEKYLNSPDKVSTKELLTEVYIPIK